MLNDRASTRWAVPCGVDWYLSGVGDAVRRDESECRASVIPRSMQ